MVLSFMTVHVDPAVTYCAPFKPEETVYSFLMFSFDLCPKKKKNSSFLKMRLFIQVRYKTQREPQHEVQTVKKTTTKKRRRKWKKKKKQATMFWFCFGLWFAVLQSQQQ